MKEGRKPEYPEKTPGDELQKMNHVLLSQQVRPYSVPCMLLRHGVIQDRDY